jgi:5-methyltetrahydrofolate--homocysteine methyltransferase
MARYLGEFARGGLINIAGGCCGNTPEHIAAIAKALEGREPRALDRAQGTGHRAQDGEEVVLESEGSR